MVSESTADSSVSSVSSMVSMARPFVGEAVREAGRPRDDAVHAVGADDDPCANGRARDRPHREPLVCRAQCRTPAHLRRPRPRRRAQRREGRRRTPFAARSRRTATRRWRARWRPRATPSGPCGSRGWPHVERKRVAEIRKPTEHAEPDTAAAWFVAGKPLLVEQDHPDTASREGQRRQRTRRPSPDDDNVSASRHARARASVGPPRRRWPTRHPRAPS